MPRFAPAREAASSLSKMFCVSGLQTLRCLQAAKDAWDVFRPGGQLHPQYFLEHKWNFIFEGILLVVIAYMFLQRSAPSKKKHERPLSEKVS